MSDAQHPDHYRRSPTGLECLQVAERMQFCMGSATKYLWRCEHRGRKIKDLKQAQFYLTNALNDPEVCIRRTGDRTLLDFGTQLESVVPYDPFAELVSLLCYAQFHGDPNSVLQVERSINHFLTGGIQ